MLVMYLLCGLVALATIANAVVYVRYGQANYPKSQRWEYWLVGVPFLVGSLGGAAIAGREFPSVFFVLFVLGSGVACALGFRLLFVHNMQRVMPKRVTPPNRGGE